MCSNIKEHNDIIFFGDSFGFVFDIIILIFRYRNVKKLSILNFSLDNKNEYR